MHCRPPGQKRYHRQNYGQLSPHKRTNNNLADGLGKTKIGHGKTHANSDGKGKCNEEAKFNER